MKTGWRNQHHPELQPGEYFAGNVKPGPDERSYYHPLKDGLQALKKGERLGKTAYDCYGNHTRGVVPLFVRR